MHVMSQRGLNKIVLILFIGCFQTCMGRFEKKKFVWQPQSGAYKLVMGVNIFIHYYVDKIAIKNNAHNVPEINHTAISMQSCRAKIMLDLRLLLYRQENVFWMIIMSR